MPDITKQELRIIFDAILESLDFEGVSRISIGERDLYNLIPTDQWHDLSQKNVVIGSIVDDLEQLHQLVYDDSRVCNFVDFDRLAAILREISEKLNPGD